MIAPRSVGCVGGLALAAGALIYVLVASTGCTSEKPAVSPLVAAAPSCPAVAPPAAAVAAAAAAAPPPPPPPHDAASYGHWRASDAARHRVMARLAEYTTALGQGGDAAPAVQTAGSMSVTQHNLYLEDAARARVVCETGFKDGISANFWLSASETSQLHSFDLKFPAPTSAGMAWLEAKFRGRFQIYAGDSKVTVPTLPDGTCDLISIDGDHSEAGVWADILNFRSKAACDHIVYLDDVFDCDDPLPHCTECGACDCFSYRGCNDASRAVQRAVREGVAELHTCLEMPAQKSPWGTFVKGFCIMTYKDVC